MNNKNDQLIGTKKQISPQFFVLGKVFAPPPLAVPVICRP